MQKAPISSRDDGEGFLPKSGVDVEMFDTIPVNLEIPLDSELLVGTTDG